MTNRLWNAGFLELASGWTTSDGANLTVDEGGRGVAGVAVLVATASVDAGQSLRIATAPAQRVAVLAGETLEAAAAVVALAGGAAAFSDGSTFSDGGFFTSAGLDVGSPVPPALRLVFFDGDGVESVSVDLDVRPPALAIHGEGLAGALDTFRLARRRVVVPAGAVSAGLELSALSTAAAQPLRLLLTRPMIGGVPAARTTPLSWDPGRHIDEDLALGVWPGVLAPFASGPGSEPAAGRIEFGGGSGRPASRRTAHDPARRFAGRVRCDAVQRAALEAFWRDGPSDFFFIEPDTQRLCIASWAQDGAPKMGETRGPTVMMDVGLWLETA